MLNITDTTCDFGLAQTDGECSRSFASLNESPYLRTQIIYLGIGLVSVVVSSFLYWRAVRYDANRLQQHSLVLCAYASLTFIFRSADPNSYKHAIPHPVVCYFSDSCTAALYSIFILSLSYWASVIQRGAAHIQRPLDLRYLEWTAIAILWCFYLALDMCLFLTKGFFKSFMTYLQLLISAGLLALIGFSFLVYGMRVRSRLRHFERQRMIFELRNNTYQPADTSRSDYDPNETRLEDGRIDMDGKYGPRRSRTNTQGAGKSHANKILKIVAVVEVFVVLVVAAQIYTTVVRSSRSSELDCANGDGCDDIKSSVNMLHWFQLAAVWVILWVYHKVEARPEEPEDSD